MWSRREGLGQVLALGDHGGVGMASERDRAWLCAVKWGSETGVWGAGPQREL